MTLTLFESIQRIVREELRQVRTPELAVVAGAAPARERLRHRQLRVHGRAARLGASSCSEVPVATGRIGAASIPAVGELVLVQFVGGDINAPVIVGRLYNDEDRPPANEDGKAVLHLPLGAADCDAVHVELRAATSATIVLKLGSGLELTLPGRRPGREDRRRRRHGHAADRQGRRASSPEQRQRSSSRATEITVEAQGQLTLKGATVNIN